MRKDCDSEVCSPFRHIPCFSLVPDKNPWLVQARVNRGVLSMKLDTGSMADVIDLPGLQTLCYQREDLSPSFTVLVTFSKHRLHPIGILHTTLTANGCTIPVDIEVLESCPRAIMGISTARRLGLVPGSTKVDKMSLDFPDAVSKFISLYSTPVGLEIDHAVRPHADRPRTVPLSLRPKVEAELQQMIRDGIIEKRVASTPWVSPMLVRVKLDG